MRSFAHGKHFNRKGLAIFSQKNGFNGPKVKAICPLFRTLWSVILCAFEIDETSANASRETSL